MNGLSPTSSASNLKIIKTDFKPSGEAVQLVRPLVANNKSTDQIVGELVNRFDYKTRDVKASENELTTVQQAFGSNLAQELIQSYDGSNLVADSQQDLVGERYLAEQIRLIQEQQRTTSVLDKWSHLLYEGERDYRSASKNEIPPINLNENYENKSASNYSLLLDQQQAQQQAQYIQQLQQIQMQQKQQLLKHQQAQQQLHEQMEQQQQLKHSQSQNLQSASSFQRAASGVSQNSLPAGYAHSQSGLNARTLSDLRLAQQIKANQLATAQYRAQYEAQLEALTQAEVIAQAYAQAQAQAEAHVQASQTHSQAIAQNQVEEEQEPEPETEPERVQSISRVYSRQNVQANQLKKSTSVVHGNIPKFSNSNLNSITIDAYNSPQFREMLEQLTKPLTIPPEQVNYPPEWPSQDKINLLAEPIYIPAPQPIVIPAPNILTLQNNSDLDKVYNRSDINESSIKPSVTYYPSLDNDQKSFGIRQLNIDDRSSYQQQTAQY